MASTCVEGRSMKWQDLNADQRYEMIAMVRSGKTTVAKLSASLEVKRQTLYKAIEAVEAAAKAALEPGKPGRKPKYDVVKTLLDLERMLERGEDLPGEKKRRKPGPAGNRAPGASAPELSGPGGSGQPLEPTTDGGRAGNLDRDRAVVDGTEGARGGP
jgi:transposase-like protein